tara:strand:+ start:2284 stop:2475 length:192 start_codon:yes stop_codon:yes gene_type:complete
MNNETRISTEQVLNGGTIELWKLEGFYYVKSIVNGAVKFSGCVGKWYAEQFVFEAKYCGSLDF